MTSPRRRWTIFITTLLLTFGGPALAQDPTTPVADTTPDRPDVVFGVYPEGGAEGQYFEAFVEPGAGHAFTLALRNAGEEPLTLLAYPANAYSMTNGGMGVTFQDQERTAPTTWLDFPEGTFDVTPGEEALVPFTATVPDGTAPGQYVTAIGVETADSFAVGEENGAFRQVLRKVIAVVIIVPGEAEPSFVLGEPELVLQQGNSVLRIPVENTGNVRVRPSGMVTLTDASGTEIATGDVAMGSVYRGDTAPYELWMPVSLPEGEYIVTVDLTDPDTGARGSLSDAPVTLAPPPATPEPENTPVVVAAPTPTPVPEPVTLETVRIEPNADPLQFANVELEITNTGQHLARTRVTLGVTHDGEHVEDLVLDDNLPLPEGTTSVSQRYIPPTGWEPGEWTFSVTVRSINPNADSETVVLIEEDIATIEVP